MLTPLLRPLSDTEWAVNDAATGTRYGFIVRENGAYHLTDISDRDLGAFYTLDQAANALPSSLLPADRSGRGALTQAGFMLGVLLRRRRTLVLAAVGVALILAPLAAPMRRR